MALTKTDKHCSFDHSNQSTNAQSSHKLSGELTWKLIILCETICCNGDLLRLCAFTIMIIFVYAELTLLLCFVLRPIFLYSDLVPQLYRTIFCCYVGWSYIILTNIISWR